MDNITSKEINPYLPYGLKVLSPKHSIKYGERTPLVLNGLSFQQTKGEWQYEFVASDGDLLFGMINDTAYTPLLRPLSSLTKEITHNGKTFVPAEILFKCTDFEEDLGLPGCYEKAKEFSENKDRLDLCFPLGWWQLLFEWHFDVFNLIGRGLALPLEE